MSLMDVILLGAILALVLLAARSVYKAKKSGSPCIGCTAGKGCCRCCAAAHPEKKK